MRLISCSSRLSIAGLVAGLSWSVADAETWPHSCTPLAKVVEMAQAGLPTVPLSKREGAAAFAEQPQLVAVDREYAQVFFRDMSSRQAVIASSDCDGRIQYSVAKLMDDAECRDFLSCLE